MACLRDVSEHAHLVPRPGREALVPVGAMTAPTPNRSRRSSSSMWTRSGVPRAKPAVGVSFALRVTVAAIVRAERG